MLEYRVKAAFLYNFAKFVSWPARKLPGSDDPIRFCILASDPLVPALQDALNGKSIDQHPLLLQLVPRSEDMRACDVAYLGAVDTAKLPAVLTALAGSGALTVYEGEHTQSAGVVRFYLDERKVRFEINTAAAEREGLTLSSRLLGVASVVRE